MRQAIQQYWLAHENAENAYNLAYEAKRHQQALIDITSGARLVHWEIGLSVLALLILVGLVVLAYFFWPRRSA